MCLQLKRLFSFILLHRDKNALKTQMFGMERVQGNQMQI